MPPKTRKGKSVTKEADPPANSKKEEEKVPTRATRNRSNASADPVPAKKVKKDSSPEQPQPAKGKSKAKGGKAKKSPSPQPAKKDVSPPAKEPVKQAAKQQLKKVVMKGKAPVDQYVSQASEYYVHQENGKVYAATLNQSNIQANNNKFYILQVLRHNTNPNQFIFFTRWGRVGVPGQQAPIFCPNSASAIHQFNKKLREKLNGGYREVEMNYQADDEKKQQEKKEKAKKKDDQPEVESNLPTAVKDLIKLIFDMKMINNTMKEIGYDAKKMPLGKLAKGSIMRGYEALKGLMEELKKNKTDRNVINQLSSDFYSEIPHDFGFARMQNFVLDTEKKVKAKLEMLQSLQDIQVFTKLLDEGNIENVNQLDSNYLKLDTTITPLDKNSERYKLLVEYVDNTHASTHTAYKLEVEDIFELSKESENKRFREDIDNKQLLWHGSRLTNFVGILSQGLRIAPPEAPVTGYMFGKGVYFADMVTKSANYCFASHMASTGLMLLCEVALGGINEKYHADYYANLLPPGKHSTKGLGKTAPGSGTFIDGGKVYVPSGKGVPTNIPNSSLLYNEFIVYDVAQIKSRYLFRMRFNYNYHRSGLFGF